MTEILYKWLNGREATHVDNCHYRLKSKPRGTQHGTKRGKQSASGKVLASSTTPTEE